ELCETAYGALDGSDALVIITEWQEFRSPDFDRVKKVLNDPLIFDGRNLFDPGLLKTMGIMYYAIGRGNAGAKSDSPYGLRKTDMADSF
ncbi:MAG: UDP binding domain-containing protein, partial [Woeseiaceae bacterium]